jgi:hypothetical protein
MSGDNFPAILKKIDEIYEIVKKSMEATVDANR